MASVQEYVDKAVSFNGYLEKATNAQLDNFTANAGDNNYTRFARDYDAYMSVGTHPNSQAWSGTLQRQPWCAVFVCTIAIYLGISDLDFPKFAYCPYGIQYFKNIGAYTARASASPQAGDIIFFTNGKESNHVGIVTKVSGSTVYTIEGNTSSASGVVDNGGCVRNKSYDKNNTRIHGYGRPVYSELKADKYGCYYEMDKSIVNEGYIGTNVKAIQERLVLLGYSVGKAGIDGDYGADTVAAVKQFQKDVLLSPTGNADLLTKETIQEATEYLVPEGLYMSQLEKLLESTIKKILNGQDTTVPAWALDGDEYSKSIEEGITDGSRPEGYATRCEAAVMVYRAKQAILKSKTTK